VFRAALILIVVLLLLRAVWRLLGGVVQGAMSAGPAAGPRRRAAPPAVKMARDPICGTYVVPGKALELAKGRETMYFCSARCRDEWLNAR
jgi:hypothetical protein